jgi:ribosome-binding factor A
MNKTRLTRIDDEIMKEAAVLMRGGLKDPRLNKFITVTRAKTTSDLKFCKIYVSVMGTAEEKSEVMSALEKSAGFFRSELAHSINLRNTPEISFVLDESLDESLRMSKILDEIKREQM